MTPLASALTLHVPMTRIALALLLAFAGAVASAQNPSTSDFSTLGRTAYDAKLASMGGAGAFLPDVAPVASLSNPARLAMALEAPGTRLSLSGAPDAYDFVFAREQLGVEIDQSIDVLAASTLAPLPIPLVLAVATGSNTQAFASEDSEITDRSVALSAATRAGGQRAYLDIGLTGRLARASYFLPLAIDETLSPAPIDESSLRAGADVGLTATVVAVQPPRVPAGIQPSLALSAGYVQRAMGSPFRFGDAVVADGEPLGGTEVQQPRSATVGYAVQAGLSRVVNGQALSLLVVDLAVEAEADLNERDGFSTVDDGNDGAALVGPLRFQDVVFGTSGDSDVQGRRGLRLTFGDALRVSVGRASTESRFPEVFGAGVYASWGVGLDVTGALRTAGVLRGDRRLAAASRRYDLSLDFARGALDTDDGTVLRYGIAGVTAGVRFGTP